MRQSKTKKEIFRTKKGFVIVTHPGFNLPAIPLPFGKPSSGTVFPLCQQVKVNLMQWVQSIIDYAYGLKEYNDCIVREVSMNRKTFTAFSILFDGIADEESLWSAEIKIDKSLPNGVILLTNHDPKGNEKAFQIIVHPRQLEILDKDTK